MKSKVTRVYLDLNVIDFIYRKGIQSESLKKTGIKYFISVAHAEEFYRMIKDDIKNENRESIDKKLNIMTELVSEGVLNPSKTRIIHKQESFYSALDRVKVFDTTHIIDEKGESCYEQFKSTYCKLQEENKGAKYHTTISPEKIWNEEVIKSEVEKFDDYKIYYNKITENQLLQIYGIYALEKINKPITCDLQPKCYSNIKNSYNDLECVIEFLFNILEECGYNKNDNVRKSISGIHDIQHAIYASYCNLLVSNDTPFRKKAEAVYYYLGVPIKVIDFENYFSYYFQNDHQ